MNHTKFLFTTTILIILGTIDLLTPFVVVDAQFLHPTMPDRVYLDKIEKIVSQDAMEAKTILMEEAKLLQNLTANYLVATVKRNVYENLQKMSEEEVKSAILAAAAAHLQLPLPLPLVDSQASKRPRQSEGESDLDPTTVELGTIISGIVFKNLQVIARVPTILLESVKKSFPEVFGGTTTTTVNPVSAITSESSNNGGKIQSRFLNFDHPETSKMASFSSSWVQNLFETVSHFIDHNGAQF